MDAPTRVPSNACPADYGSLDISRIQSNMTQLSLTHSFHTAMESLTGVISRASILYPAENIIITPSRHDHDAVYESDEFPGKRWPGKTAIEAEMQENTHDLTRYSTIASLLSDGTQSSLFLKSTAVHATFNAVNVLIGVGVLALPYAFCLTGWVYGSLLLCFCCITTNYTAKIIIRCLQVQPGAATYGDMGAIAFGHRGRALVGGIFIIELITIGVAMIILLGDALMSLFPLVPMVSSRFIACWLTAPTLFLPIRKLAYTSFVGIVSCFSLLIIVLYDGLSKKEAPGSLLDPELTEWTPSTKYMIPLSFGLIMSGFTGHAVFPSIYRDMAEPKQFNQVVNVSYLITMITYVSMAFAGYAMFGSYTAPEITQNLAAVAQYNQILNAAILWLVFLTPIAKYGVMMNPLNMAWQHYLLSWPHIDEWYQQTSLRRKTFDCISKLSLHGCIVLIAIVFPLFDRVMSLLGSLFSFGISIIFPLICHIRLFHDSLSTTQIVMDSLILVLTFCMMVLGTTWSFLPTDSVP